MTTRRWIASLTLTVLAAAGDAAAQLGEPYVVRLLGGGSTSTTLDSLPHGYATAGGLAFFATGDVGGPEGNEVWRSDGTPEGTFLLADLCPGSCGSSIEHAVDVRGRILLLIEQSQRAQQLWVSDGTTAGTVCLFADLSFQPGPLLGEPGGETLLFLASTPGGDGLWATDGTAAGTRLLHSLPGELQFGPEFVELGGVVLFAADDGLSGRELWRTDGTQAGTFRVRDLQPGGAGSEIHSMTRVGGGTVFFLASGAGGDGLWRTDGTAAGTVFVEDPTGGSRFAEEPRDLTAVGDRLFFIGESPTTNLGLWVSDGTADGTFLVHPLGQAGLGNHVPDVAATEDRFWVLAAPFGPLRLWVSDGTPAGTVQVGEGLDFGTIEGPPDFPYLRADRDRVFVAADDGESGLEPWVTDGTPGDTFRLADTCSGECSGAPRGFWLYGGRVYFQTENEAGIPEIWASDGSPGGTQRLLEVCSSPCGDGMLPLLEWRGELYFVTDDFGGPLWKTDGTPEGTIRLHEEAFAEAVAVGDALLFTGNDDAYGREPWRTDGTPAGTRMVRDLENGGGSSARLGSAVAYSGGLLLNQGFEGSHSLWASDGTPQGTVELIGPGRGLGGLRSVGDRAYLAVETSGAGIDLWITDGTPAGTVPLTDFDGVTASIPFPPRLLGTLGQQAFFYAGGFLWRSDGTVDGTLPVVRLREHREAPPPEIGARVPAQSGAVGGRLAFGASQNQGDPVRLWRSNGTAGGTRPLGPADATFPYDFVEAGPRLYFRTGDDRVWVTDGTDGGTRALAGPFFFGSVRVLAAAGGRLFFAAEDAAGDELWTSDGTPAGTLRLDLNPGSGSSEPSDLRAAGAGRVYFAADDGVHGRELWLSDGTAAGTRMVVDLVPGPHGSDPASLEVAAGRVFFAAQDLAHGREPWSSDGTAAGTRRIADLTPGPAPSNPSGLIASGDRLYFHAEGAGVGGTPLWALPLRPIPAPAPPKPPSSFRLTGVDAFRAELAWRDEADDEAFYVIEATTPATPWQPVAFLPPDTEEIEVSQVRERPTAYRIRAENRGGSSEPGPPVSATSVPSHSVCTPDAETLCLLDGRFEVRVEWRDQRSGDTGTGRAAPFPGSGRTGTFSFFDPDNVELIVKALDGTGTNGAFWSFYGALSDVEYWVTVYDVARRRSRTYYNPPGEICGVGDTAAFPAPLGAPALAAPAAGSFEIPSPPRLGSRPAPGTIGACQAGPETLCLLVGRLKVEVDWKNQRDGGSGPGRAVAGTDKTGYFWFFSPSNVELVVKALDGTPVNGHLWVFWGALTDVEYTITVTDTETGVPVEYHNPPGEICGGADTSAF